MIKSNFNFIHKPVLLNESINFLTNKKNTIFIDGTFGDGGHTRALLEKNKTCKVYAIDRDPNVKENAKFFQKKYSKRFKFISGKISDLEKIASHENLKNKINGIIFDLGVSTRQLKDSKRGFSFQNDGPLDMRMEENGTTAEEFLNSQNEKKLSDIIFKYGEYFEQLGPMWIGRLWDNKLVQKIEGNKTIELIKGESKLNVFGYFDYHSIAKNIKNKGDLPKMKILIEKINKKGYIATRTHFSPTGIRSNIPPRTFLKLLTK